MDEDERQRKIEAGRAKFASHRQKRAKSNGQVAQKTTQKRKGPSPAPHVSPAQGCPLEALPRADGDSAEPEHRSNHEEPQSVVETHQSLISEVLCSPEHLEPSHARDGNHILGGQAVGEPPEGMEVVGEEDLLVLTGKEPLKQLQAAVEKRNEIISRLSCNLQEALESRDQVQQEALSLTGQIEALQLQLQQTSHFFRTRTKGGSVLSPGLQQASQPDPGPNDLLHLSNHLEVSVSESGNHIDTLRTGYEHIGVECESPEQHIDSDMDELISILKRELLEEREKNLLLLSQLEEEKKGWEEERREILQYKEEKEALNRDLQDLRRRLEEEERERRKERDEEKEIRERQEEEKRRLGEEVQRVKLLLEESARTREEELGLKSSKDKVSQGSACEEEDLGDSRVEKCLLDMSITDNGDPLLERYLSSALPSHTQPPWASECLEERSFTEDGRLLDNSANYRFELNSDISCGDQSQLSFLQEEQTHVPSPQYAAPTLWVDPENQTCPSLQLQWQDNTLSVSGAASECGSERLSESSERQAEEVSDLGKELLIQQCGDLREELALREKEKEVLVEEVKRSAEELEDARARWSQVSEELQEAHWELEEEREKRRRAEEVVSLKTHEEDNLKNKLSTLLEEREKEMERLIPSPLLEEGGTLVPSLDEEIKQLKEEKSLLLSRLKEQEELLSSFRTVKKNDTEKDLELKEIDDEEKCVLLSRLRQQEQLVSSLQEVKQAGDSVSSEVHALFGRQLQSLQAHRDQLLNLLEDTKARHKTTTALLGQKTLELDTALKEMGRVQKEVKTARQEAEENERRMEKMAREKMEVESELLCLRQNLCNLEESHAQGVREREEGRMREDEMDKTMRKMEDLIGEELEEFQRQLIAKEEEMEEEREKWEVERQEKDEEVQGVRRLLEEQRREREEEVKALLEQQVRAVEEAKESMRRCHSEEVLDLQEKHQEEMSELSRRLERELYEQRTAMEEEQKKQISLIKQVNEREYQRMVSELMSQQREELSRLKAELSGEQTESMEAAHQAELLQTQSQQSLELEALRLSLTNLHTAQLELTQANLQREREASLSELQASLREKWAQEKAVLQARQQFEVERLTVEGEERSRREQQEHQRNMDSLRQECESRASQERAVLEERHAAEIETLRSQWQQESEEKHLELKTRLSEAQALVSSTQEALTQAGADLSHARASLEELQVSGQKEIQRLEEELSQAWADRDAAARAVEDLVTSHRVVLQEREEHIRHLQQELGCLQGEQVTLRQACDQEVSQLWAQLDNMRTSRQELGELKEQLLARSTRVNDIERLKAEFNQQRREIKEQNEVELENLRRYFEQRLRVTEESYREEIALLQLRLVEGALEDSVLQTQDASFLSEGRGEEERNNVLAEITAKLEKHKEEFDCLRVQLEERHTQELSRLRSSLSLSHREELLQVRSDLTDRYYSDLQELKTRHAVETEQLRAKLSDSHVRELTRVRLEAARQVEVEVEQRVWGLSEELQTRMTVIQNLETQLADLADTHALELHSHTLKLKQSFAEELAKTLAEELKEERERLMKDMTLMREEEVQRLRQDLQEQEGAHVSALRAEMEKRMEDERRALEKRMEDERRALEKRMEDERRALEKGMEEAREALRSLQASLDNDQNPHAVAVRQKLEAQYEAELTRAKSSMAAEVKEVTALLQEQGDNRLRQAQDRFQEEREELEQRLAQQGEVPLGQLREEHTASIELLRTTLMTNHTHEMETLQTNHKAELDSLLACHKAELDAMAMELAIKHKEELVVLETSLESKRKAELDRLEAVLQETSQAQLEAQEAELEHRHREERDELEVRMLGNMDTLEATYLREIQALRDEKAALEVEHRQEMERERSRLEQERLEQQSVREELKRELAQLHMEKFSAMATELSHVQQNELSVQKEALQAEHHRALEALQNKVLELEQQHSNALAKLSHTYDSETQQLNTQYQQQLQELKSTSTRELQACRRELEEESSRQRLHFLEEVELLKAQAEETFQQKTSQLKAEFEQQKEAELKEQRQAFTTEQEHKEQSYVDKMSQLTTQLLQLDSVVSQLRDEVGSLQGELEGKRSEMETLDTLLQRRERESQEGGNLVHMLTEDLHAAQEERHSLHSANERLRKILVEVVLSTMAMEELIGRRVKASVGVRCEGDRPGEETTNQETGVTIADLSSGDLDLSQRVCESLLLAESQTHSGVEDAALGACSRLRHSVDTLLELLTHAKTQLEESCSVHLSLEEKFSQGRSDSSQMLLQHQLLLDQLDQEAGLKSKLQLELHKAEGLLDGYVAEKAALEECLQQKEAQEERLVEELEGLRAQLHQMEGLRAQLENLKVQLLELREENTLLLRQKEHLTAGLGETEKGLLAEAERLAEERLSVQLQADKDRSSLSQRLRALETELEEQESQGLTAEQRHRALSEDLQQRVQALEKQLKHNRQFIDEQAVEREHERDEFQQEIRRLEAQLKQPSRHLTGDNQGQRIEDLVLQVESLQALIRDKTEDHASLLATNQQAQFEVAERNEEIDKLAGRIRELEQALLCSSESSRAVTQLEQELGRARQREKELIQDKESLQQQQLSNRLQISALQSKLDETRHRYQDNNNPDAPDPVQHLRDTLDTAQEHLRDKEQQVSLLVGQLEETQRDLTIKEAELKHLTLQLELLTNQHATTVTELKDRVAALQETVSTLTYRLEERAMEGERDEEKREESLPSALLEEKNAEIDHLTQEIHRLEQELQTTRDSREAETEIEDLRSQVEHLRSDIIRVRQDKQEEEERLHEVISTLQAELNTLGPVYNEVSDLSQEGDSVNPSPAPSPEPAHHLEYPQRERGGKGDSLKQEMRLLRSSSSRSLHSRVEVLQGQLEMVMGEKEAMERLLLSQEEEYRGHEEEIGRRLREERERADEVKRGLTLRQAELEEVVAQKEELEARNAAMEEERGRSQALAQETSSLQREKDRLEVLVRELTSREEEREKDTDALRQTVAALETAKEELSSEREALRKRERHLQEEIERLQREVASEKARLHELSSQLEERGANQEEAQKEVLTCAEETLAKADAALRQREEELRKLGAEHQVLRAELAAVKEGLCSSTERAEKLLEEGQTKDRALADLETNNQHLKAELRGLQEDLAVQEEELAYQQQELRHLRQTCNPHIRHTQSLKDVSPSGFQDSVSRNASLSSPEVLRRLECSEERTRDDRFNPSFLHGSRLSDLTALNNTGLELQVNASLNGRQDQPGLGTISPELGTNSTRSPVSISASDNLSMLDSMDADKVCELEALDLTAPPSSLGSASSLSAPEWASDGYGSNVSSELGVRLKVELEQTERLDAQFLEYLRCRGMNPAANTHTDSAAGSMNHSDEMLSPELQGLLRRVYQESCRVLVLSQRNGPTSSNCLSLDKTVCQSDCKAPPMGWEQEKRLLQGTVISLRELLCRMAQRPESLVDAGWSRSLQAAVTGVFDCERAGLCSELQAFLSAHPEMDSTHLLSQLDTLLQRQGEQQRVVLENLASADRHDLQPQQTQDESSNEVLFRLRAELEESRERLNSSHSTQQELHTVISKLRLCVEECEEAVRREQTRAQQLVQEVEQERTQRHLWEEQQRTELVILRGQLDQERTTSSNLRQEIQIELSRGRLLQSQLDTRLTEAQKDLEEERNRSARELEVLQSQEKSRLEQHLKEAESRLSEAHRKELEAERECSARHLDDITRRQEADVSRDREFISELRSQLQQERKQGEELAIVNDRLRAELLQIQRRGEEEEKKRRQEAQTQHEATSRLRVTLETLQEQKQEASRVLEKERERSGRLRSELNQLKETLRVVKEKERVREEQRERERRKDSQELTERERRHERVSNQLCELELLRQQDQQRLRDLQHTLAELEREEREMAKQRLSNHLQPRNSTSTGLEQTSTASYNRQTTSSSALVERLLRENSDLANRVTELSQERVNLKHNLSSLERQLRHMETENRPSADLHNSKFQRLYERYLRAESFRKSLVYQKRYLLLLLGGFQDCEQATLCLIARMGAQPSPPHAHTRTPLARFRAAVRAIVAISRLKFLTRKWQRVVRRGVTTTVTVNGHGTGPSSRTEVLRQQPLANHNSSPPTRDSSPSLKGVVSPQVQRIKSPFRLHNSVYSNTVLSSERAPSSVPSQDAERSLTDYIHHLENVQQRLGAAQTGSSSLLSYPKESDR
ncbi:pericentrin isoform X3 [Esox lucius]|uniref:ELK domain-containing protein n=1 Tax=Esox lucius TaxID=8010 RepID=A0AAY5K0U0_ESOLU|nr:pericentrin isoform X3 [Esox lucius]